MMKAKVSIVKTGKDPEYEEIRDAVENALDRIGGIEDLVQPGYLVLIKPNLVAEPAEKEKGSVTVPEVSRALADIVKKLGAHPIIADSAAVGVDTEKVIQGARYDKLREIGYEVIDLKKTSRVSLPVENGRVFQEVPCWELAKKADVIITVPKLKTHDQTEMTCAIKNLKGLFTDKGKRDNHKKGLFEGVIDLLTAVKPQLAVVDGIICQEGAGPIYGRPVEMDLIIAGKDIVAVDSTCARIIGYEPNETYLTVNAANRSLGVMDPDQIEIVGESISTVKRPFLRSIEDNPVKAKNFHWISDTTTCTGCRNTVMATLMEMRRADQLGYLEGMAIITGDVPLPNDVPREKVVTVGKCVPKKNRIGTRYVEGCPPNSTPIVKAIIGDRAEVKRPYAEKKLDETDSDSDN